MKRGYEFENGVIIINRNLTKLDLFVKKFLDVLKKHSDYLIVSGFVSIATGRTRGTEDVDILILKMKKEEFGKLFEELHKNNFWCYQGDEAGEVYPYVENMQNIRFAEKNKILPNIELVFIDETKRTQYFEFKNPQKIKVEDFEFKIPPIEFEILYKEILLSGKKDFEDAKHLRTFFSDILHKDKFERFEKIIRDGLK